MVLHPDGGHDVRRRPAQRRAQARSLGLAELRRGHHRRDSLPQARPRSWPQGHARGTLELLHEESADADPRRHRVQPSRGVHPRRGQRDTRGHRDASEANAPKARFGAGPAEGSGPGEVSRSADQTRKGGAAFEAPHRRLDPGSRIAGKAAVFGYRATAWLLGRVAPRLAWRVGGRLAQAGYVFGPKKRRWVNANFGHILGVPPDDPEVRRLALRAYGNYARYLVELMRLPGLPHEAASQLLDPQGVETFEEIRRESKGIILVAAHVGNNEAAAVGLASKGWPVSAVADDSAFPELFDLLRRQREAWGVRLIPWRNLRDVYGVLKRHEMLALLVDWGYKPDGIPVRLFGSW